MGLLATLVLTLWGCGDGNGAPAPDDGPATPDAEGVLTVEAGDLYFSPTRLLSPAGELHLRLVNTGAVVHDLVVEEAGDVIVAFAHPGETVTGRIELEPGTYALYCSIPGHRAQMQASLEVT